MYYGARGIVGLVKPTYRPGSMESFIKLMPEGVGFIPAHELQAGAHQRNCDGRHSAAAYDEKHARSGLFTVHGKDLEPAAV